MPLVSRCDGMRRVGWAATALFALAVGACGGAATGTPTDSDPVGVTAAIGVAAQADGAMPAVRAVQAERTITLNGGPLRVVSMDLVPLPGSPAPSGKVVSCTFRVKVENMGWRGVGPATGIAVESHLETASYPKVYADDDLRGPTALHPRVIGTYEHGLFTAVRGAPIFASVHLRWKGGASTLANRFPLYCAG